MRRTRPRTRIAWLAILALLINVLVPASLAAGSGGQGPETVSGWCGSGAAGHPPAKEPALATCQHCVLCTAASGLTPPLEPGIGLPVPVAMTIRAGSAIAAASSRSAYSPAQPRGPPAAARS
jgi:hypothetical protein